MHLPVPQRSVLAGASVEARVEGVGGAGQADCFPPLAATLRGGRGRQRHQRDVTRAEGHGDLAEPNLVAAAAQLTAVCVRTVVNAHLGDGHAQHGLQLQKIKEL